MKHTLLMERVCGQMRLAVIEENKLCELIVERPGHPDSLTGNLYLGRVENVLPGMNAAFVNIGCEKNAFLSAGDIAVGDRALTQSLSDEHIEKLVRPGQDVLVQVTKAATGEKGPRVSTHITLPGRSLVLLSEVEYVGVSRKITDERERARLSAFLRERLAGSGMGAIARTAAEGVPPEELEAELTRLQGHWKAIAERARHGLAPRLIHDDQSLPLRVVRDRLTADTEALWVDDPELYEEMRGLAGALAPQWSDAVRLHDTSTPLFDIYRVDEQLDRALCRMVHLKSGGTLVIDETEALTVIDVNTGKYIGKGDLEETIYRNNLEAAQTLMRLLRLREIGGIVIVDFIDMQGAAHKQGLLAELRRLARLDRNAVNVLGLTGLGLVEMTRKKARQPLNRQLMHTCPLCGGSGETPSLETAARRIQREIWRRRRSGDGSALLVEAATPLVEALEKLGVPEDWKVYAHSAGDLKGGAHRISPVDESRLSAGTRLLK